MLHQARYPANIRLSDISRRGSAENQTVRYGLRK